MSRWWRAYDEAVDDPKLMLLSDRAHRAWFNLMCLASVGDGRLPERKVIELKLRLSPSKTQAVLTELVEAGLIDESDDGLTPHNWNGRQYKSDVSTERVQRFRERERNVSVTPPENRIQITDTEKKNIRAVAPATRTDPEFDEFWKEYPKRGTAANPKKPAKEKFERLVKSGIDSTIIISAARRFCKIERDAGRFGTEKVAMAITWLNQERFNDYGPPATASPMQPPPGLPTDAELRERYGQPNRTVQTQTEATRVNGNGADYEGELRRESAEIRPTIRSF